MTQAPTAHEERQSRRKAGHDRVAPLGRADRRGAAAHRARARRRRADPPGPRRRPRRLLLQHRQARPAELDRAAGHDHTLRAAAAAGREPDRRLPRRPLEPRRRRAVPAGRSDRRSACAGAGHGAAGLAGAAAGDGGGDGRGRRLVAAAGAAQGLLRGQRDRDHADDEFSGDQRGERAHQAPLRRPHHHRAADRDAGDRRPPAAPLRQHHQRGRDRGPRGDPVHPLADDADLVRPAPAPRGCEPARGGARGAAARRADGRRVRAERGPRRACGLGGDPRRLGQRAGRLEPGLRPDDHSHWSSSPASTASP